MTESEFTAGVSSGAITIETPDSEPDTSNNEGGVSLDQFLPILTLLQSTQRALTKAPTNVPKTFQDQIQFVYDGTNYYLYLYFSNAWQKVQLNNASVVSKIIAGSGIAISPSGGTGNVTISLSALYAQVASGTFYLYQDTSSSSSNSATPVKVHEIQFASSMPTSTFNVAFAIQGGYSGSPSQTCMGQIYKNGVAYGTAHAATQNTTSFSTFSDTLSFAAGDKCELYLWYTGSNLGNTAYNNFGLQGIPIPTYLIPTKLS